MIIFQYQHITIFYILIYKRLHKSHDTYDHITIPQLNVALCLRNCEVKLCTESDSFITMKS
jgi:hypothetical protein